MSEITFTPNKDFDPANAQSLVSHPPFDTNTSYTISEPYNDGRYFALYGNNGFQLNYRDGAVTALSYDTGGISFDFSDNTAGVTIVGGNFGDVLRGGTGNDALNGGGGNDVLEGGLGTNTINGGSGTNTVSYEHFDDGSGMGVSLYTGSASQQGDAESLSFTQTGVYTVRDTLTNIQNVRGSKFDDYLSSDGGGRNVLEGGGSGDNYYGDSSDIVSYQHSDEGVTVTLGINGRQTSKDAAGNSTDADGDYLSGIENLYGSTHADTLTGDSMDNALYGMGGADSLSGGDGNDHLFITQTPTLVSGGNGNDQLQLLGTGSFTFTTDNFSGIEGVIIMGGQTANFSGVSTGEAIASRSTAGGASATIIGTTQNDRIIAGSAGDSITGGRGADVLTGGAGSDTFHYNTTGFGRDVLYNVDTTMDHLDLSGIASSSADLVFKQGGSGATLGTTVMVKGNTSDTILLKGITAAQAQTAGFITYGAAPQFNAAFTHALFDAASTSSGQSDSTLAPAPEPVANHLTASNALS